ncbi:MAG: YCF48-related protein [Ignavibacteria bacterium]|nr:T9SS type A sorting domain-containing protein [Ignavibacteria bacterium]
MKTFYIIILLLMTSITLAQSAWFWQNPTPQGYDIRSVTFLDSQTGIAVGNYGAILRSDNGGETWNPVYVNYRNDFLCVRQLSGATAFVTGSDGIILRTTTAGISWERISSIITDTISSIFFTDQNSGYAACGRGKVYKTTNAGNMWSEQFTGINSTLNSIFFVNKDTGFVCGDLGRALKTTNAGSNWNSIANIQGADLNSVWFRNANSGFIAGGSEGSRALRRTTNGGQTWLSMFLSVTAGELTQIFFVDDNTGYISGKSNTLFITTNGGVNWGFANNITQPGLSFNTVHFSTHQTGFLGGTYGIIYKTTDGASVWNQKLPFGLKEEGREIDVPDDQTAYVLTTNKLMKTTNGGSNWNVFSEDYYPYKEIQFMNANTGFVWRNFELYRTTNGAQSWNHITQNVDSIWSYQFTDANTGFGWRPVVELELYRTSNFGQNWTKLDIDNLWYYYFLDDMTGYGAVITGPRTFNLMKTTSSGQNWNYVSQLNFDSITSCRELYFLNESTGFSIQEFETQYNDRLLKIYRTGNGGLNWSEVYTTGDFIWRFGNSIDYEMNFTNLSTGYFAGLADTTLKTTDGGVTWAKYKVGDRRIREIEFINDNTGYLIGGGGMILKTTNGGTVSIAGSSSEIPERFHLKQNFPNPFNPKTKIRYSLPVADNVKLSVYDPVGRLVAILVNDFKTAGNHVAEFNAEPDSNGHSLASGIYFVVLEFGNRRESIRMALIK